jgi:translation initiation factor 1
MGLRLPCLRCGKYPPECACPAPPPDLEPPAEPAAAAAPAVERQPRPEVIRLRREKRSSGREVVVLEGFPPDLPLEPIARLLKKRCATGGTAKGRTIELQGDARDALPSILLELGFRSKRAGG